MAAAKAWRRAATTPAPHLREHPKANRRQPAGNSRNNERARVGTGWEREEEEDSQRGASRAD